MQVKIALARAAHCAAGRFLGGYIMPTDVAVITAAIVLVFIVFAAAIAWSDHYSNNAGKR
jgi:hypothetical protein